MYVKSFHPVGALLLSCCFVLLLLINGIRGCADVLAARHTHPAPARVQGLPKAHQEPPSDR
jgi:hypothetical protein